MSEIQEPVALSTRLRQGTAKVHRMAHSVVDETMSGMNREVYPHFVYALALIYSTLEFQLQKNASNPVVQLIHFPTQLNRTASLLQDLLHFQADLTLRPTPNTIAYVKRLNELGRTRPELLLSHAYTRYLGDLSGGQMLKKQFGELLGVPATPNADGLKFYEFFEIDDIKEFKNTFRAKMDSVDNINGTLHDDLVAEAVTAFELNTRIFADIHSIYMQQRYLEKSAWSNQVIGATKSLRSSLRRIETVVYLTLMMFLLGSWLYLRSA
ncbi:heme oxygenase-domain-containing protein [Cladochytrium replicatum]|nr:heme oxygenase-domain-containing protein [Cladochytrium replicatum]